MKEAKEALFVACEKDNYDEVKKILEEHKINLNAPLGSSEKPRNGTALILTGDKKIGKLLLEKGARVNYVYKNVIHSFTALDSAENTLNKMNDSDDRKIMIVEYIKFLKDNEAKTYKDLQKEEK